MSFPAKKEPERLAFPARHGPLWLAENPCSYPLMEAVNSLKGREKQIMQMRFGLIDGKEKTQKEVADEIGISQSYISRLEKRIIKKLRQI